MKLNEFKLERFFAKYEFSAKYILCASDCESFTIKELLDLEKNSEKQLKKLWLGYTESQGNPVLRKEISRLYKTAKPENVLVFSGAEEGIFIFMNALLSKGDHVIAQYPGYQSLYEVANSIGCEITAWKMDESKGWDLDLNFLRKNIRKNTKAIIINCPNNPTGYLMPKEKYETIIKIAKEKGIWVFSDEVYKFSEYNEKEMLPSACDLYDKGVSLGVMSKTLGLPGLRIGWICTKDIQLLNSMASFKDFTTICNSAPSEFLSILALKHKDKSIKRNKEIIRKNLVLLDDFFDRNKRIFSWVRPKAGSIAFPKIKFNKNVEDFCIDLVKKKGVLLLPATKYGFDDKHFRLGFGRKNMLKALEKLEEYVEENF